jgi:hypothetical protein
MTSYEYPHPSTVLYCSPPLFLGAGVRVQCGVNGKEGDEGSLNKKRKKEREKEKRKVLGLAGRRAWHGIGSVGTCYMLLLAPR